MKGDVNMKLYSLRDAWSNYRSWVLILIVFAFLPVRVSAVEIAVTGNVGEGEKLFTGERQLVNGGPACISCHNAGVGGTLGGGTLGPDLTKIWATKPFYISHAWINGGGVPLMGPIYLEHKVTEEEIEDLKAFFSAQAGKAVAAEGRPGIVKFVGSGIVGFISIMIVFSIIWRGRFRKRNKGTAHDDLWRNYAGK
jgi:mono/diheme cytochrome c family protein